MRNKFQKNHKVFVTGPGEKNGKIYKNKPGIVIERDLYYKDFLIRFYDNTEDWILQKYLRKPYERRKDKNKYER